MSSGNDWRSGETQRFVQRKNARVTLADYIERDLEARLRSNNETFRPCLTLNHLARHYGVSLTPVRKAVDHLVERELLTRQPNGRLSANRICVRRRKRVDTPTPPVDWDAVLEQELLHLSLRGDESFLREEAVAGQHAISRTLLRQVFHRLAGRGLLDHVPRRGWKVRPFREGDMAAYLDVRETLEIQALNLAKPNLEQQTLERLLVGNSSLDSDDGPRLDNDLHRYFIECSGNSYIQRFFEANGGYYTALFDYAALEDVVLSGMAYQHREILSHVLAKRWAKARTTLAHHIRSQQPVALKLLDEVRQGRKIKLIET